MLRTIAVFTLPAALIALAWLRLEDTRATGSDGLWVVLLALAPALAPTILLRLALTVPAALTAMWVALDTPATDGRAGFFGPVLDRFGDGVLDYYDIAVPFNGVQQPNMHGVLVLAIFGFSLVLAQAIAARRPLLAVFAVIAGAGWPATLYPSESVLYGALILAAALFVLAGLRTTRVVPALVAGGALVLAAAAASTSAALAKDGVLAWERWDVNSTRDPVSVSYVWDANYGGIEFPRRKTTVLRITGPKRGLYWRAATLDLFDSDRWLEAPSSVGRGQSSGTVGPGVDPSGGARSGPQGPATTDPLTNELGFDPLLPDRSREQSTWVRQDVEVVALRDQRVIGAAQPVALEGPQLGKIAAVRGRNRAGPPRSQARSAVHHLELRTSPAACRPRASRGRVPGRAGSLPRHRANAGRLVRPARSRRACRCALHGRPLRRPLAVRAALEPGPKAPRGRAHPVRRRRRDRDLAADDRRLRLRRVAARRCGVAAARALRGRR